MSARPDPLLGQIIGGRYQVMRAIGKGGMGAIYEVQHLKLRRSFALKKLSAQLSEDSEALARFQREADVVASLRHPNVVEVIDWEVLDDGSPCMILELLRGEDLHARLSRVGALPWPLLGVIADAALAALAVAHKAGIVHRDLKPQNIFLSVDDAEEEHVKLLDFGVSKIRGSDSLVTADQKLLGTPLYMSPEQADGRSDLVGPRTDVWAMGAILYEMACGRPAFAAASTPSILYRICHGEPDPLAQLRPDTPAGFAALIDQALSRQLEQRIESIEILRRGLRESLATVAQFSSSLPTPSGAGPRPKPISNVGSTSTLSSAAGQSLSQSARPRSFRALWIGGALLGVSVAAALLFVLKTPPASVVVLPPPSSPQPLVQPPPAAKIEHAPPPPSARSVTLRLQPANARVFLDGDLVAGDRVPLPEDGSVHQLRLMAGGYETQVRVLDARTPPTLEVKLRPSLRKSVQGPPVVAPVKTEPPPAPPPVAPMRPAGPKPIDP